MASEKKITMREYNGTDYDTLYPKTIAEQVDGVYSNDEVLSNSTKALYGLTDSAVPDDALALLSRFHKGLGNEYMWEKTKVVVTPAYATEEAVSGAQRVLAYSYSVTFQIADSFSVSDDGTVSLDNPETVVVPSSGDQVTPTKKIIGKYFLISGDGNTQFWSGAFYYNTIYYCPSDATFQQSGYDSHYGTYFGLIVGTVSKIVGHAKETEITFVGYVNSPDPNAYPPAVSDGYTYTALGQLGDKVKIELISYVGTNTYGENNPNILTFDFKPKFLWFVGQQSVSGGNQFSPATPSSNFYSWIATENTPTTPTNRVGFGNPNNIQGWMSADGKTLTWFNYSTSNASDQLNSSNDRYYYLAIG